MYFTKYIQIWILKARGDIKGNNDIHGHFANGLSMLFPFNMPRRFARDVFNVPDVLVDLLRCTGPLLPGG